MKTKINEILGKIPNHLLVTLLTAISILDGLIISKINLLEADITNGFTFVIFKTILVCYLVDILLEMFDKIFHKTYRIKVINSQYTHLLDRVLTSKMVDIQKLSTGKVFDAVKDIAALTADIRVSIIWIIPTIMPFMTLIYKEVRADWRMAVISIASVIISLTLTLISDKLFGWNTEAKRKKAMLQGVTVDNFMNSKTIKYLGIRTFARNRLISAQKDSWGYTVNTPQIIWFRLIDMIGISPLLINIFISRDNLNMIALILLSNHTLNNMRYHILNIAEISIELKAQKNVISDLKGDDLEKLPEISDKLSISNVMFDYGEKSEKFYIENLEFRKNERTLVYGESGEGKSSLANLIAGGIHPTTGELTRYATYYIWQETESLDDTLWHNIVFDNNDVISENEVIELFKSLNMIDWFMKLKDGFATQIGERGCKLSSGQKQRINIIRLVLAMRYHPNMIFIIDEITSNLDSVTRKLAIDLIDKECKSTLICISHNEGFDAICENKILVKDHKFTVVQ